MNARNKTSAIPKSDLKVIGAGFGRTGTTSMMEALNILGFPCYHMKECFKHNHGMLWMDACKGKEPQWDRIFEGYTATVDWPSTDFYKELMERYPDAKVILTEREFSKWYKSAKDTIAAVHPSWWMLLLNPGMGMPQHMIWDTLFQKRFSDIAFARKVYEDHIADVKRHVPKDRLLVFNVAEGWVPLCKFLGVDVPGVAFPHVNDTEEFRKMVGRMKTVGVVGNVVVGAVAVAGFAAAVALVMRWFK